MPKHTKNTAQKSLSLIRKTAQIRKKRPDWAAGFATAQVEGNKFSAIVAMKRAKARSDITKFGITKDKAEGLKDQTDGYLWFEKGTIFLAVQKGSFANARKSMQGYLKSFGLAVAMIKEADPISDSQIALMDAADDEELLALAESASDEPDDEDSDSIEAGPSDADDADPETHEDPEPQAQAASGAPSRVALSQPEQDRARAAADQVSGSVRAVLTRILGDLPGAEALGSALQERLLQRMAELPPEARSALLETAPGRLLMEATRAAVLGWTDRPDAPDALQTYPPDLPIRGAEVASHYIDLGTRVMARAGSEKRVSQMLIKQRVDGFFDDNADPQAKFAMIERLTKALLPTLKDPERLSRMFGVTPPRGIEDLPPATPGLTALRMALTEVLGQIEACRAAHAAALEAEGSSMSPESEAGFDAIAEDLTTRWTGFIGSAQTILAAGPVTAENAGTFEADARKLYAAISHRFREMDSCAAAYAPTSAAQTCGQALTRFTRDIQQVAAAA